MCLFFLSPIPTEKKRCSCTEWVPLIFIPFYNNAVDLNIISYQNFNQNFSPFQQDYKVLEHALFQSMSRWTTWRNTTRDEKSHGEREAASATRSKTWRFELLPLNKPWNLTIRNMVSKACCATQVICIFSAQFQFAWLN